MIDAPVEFPGTPEERRDNYNSHAWVYQGDPDDGDVRCGDCDCNSWGISSGWPCGADIPRTAWSGEELAQWALRNPAAATRLAEVMEAS